MTTQTTPTTTNQPSEPLILRRARALARAAGSRATTVRGIVRAAVGAYPSRRAYGFRCWRDEAVISAYPEVAVVDVPDGWHLAGWRLAGERRRLVRTRDSLSAVHREAARLAASPRSLGALRGAVTRWQRIDAPTLAEWDDADRSAATRIRAAVLRIRRAEAWASARQDGLLAAMRAVDEVVISDDDLDIRHGRQPVVLPGLTGRLTALPGHTPGERREIAP